MVRPPQSEGEALTGSLLADIVSALWFAAWLSNPPLVCSTNLFTSLTAPGTDVAANINFLTCAFFFSQCTDCKQTNKKKKTLARSHFVDDWRHAQLKEQNKNQQRQHQQKQAEMPLKAATEARRRIPSSILERRLLQAPQKPEALYEVVRCVWSSLVFGASPDGAVDLDIVPSFAHKHDGGEWEQTKLAPITSSVSAGVQWEAQAHSPQPSFGASAASPLCCTMVASSGATSGHGESVTPYLEHTLAGRAAGNAAAMLSDGEEVTNSSIGTNFDAALTPATDTEHSIIATITASTATAPSSMAECPVWVNAQRVPAVQLSPLVLRLLLWWATRPQLPSLHGVNCGGRDVWIPSKGFVQGSNDSDDSDYVLAQQRRQLEAEEPHQLRLRIADIFGLLGRRGLGVVVSDALVYGRCHDSSEAAASRCNFVFGSCSDATWRAATSYVPAVTASPAWDAKDTSQSAGNVVAETQLDLLLPPSASKADTAGVSSVGVGAEVAPTRYSLDRLLRALVELHTLSYDIASSSGTAAAAVSDADVTATGQLLRSLVHCPRLHKRVMHLFHRDESAAKAAKPFFDSAPSTTLLSCPPNHSSPVADSRHTLHTHAGAEEQGGLGTCNLRLQSFFPALTHPSPVITSEAWYTIGVLLFPSANMTSATRELLLRTPECPVQHLLAAVLALPGDDSCVSSAEGGARSTRPPASHPMARNSALRALHVMCASKDVPPAVQLLFTQCPALLWRVLRLAAELCKGNPVANLALVRRVLADYVMAAVRPSTALKAAATFTPIQQLLRSNKEALRTLFLSTYAMWGLRGGLPGAAAEDSGGDLAEDTTDAVYAEEDLQRAVEMLQE
jgi:hypothetical protein